MLVQISKWIAVLSLSLATGLAVQAQTTSQPVVQDIIIKYVGPKNVSEAAVMSYLQIKEGQPYEPMLVDRSIRSLKAKGLFEHVEVSEDLAGDTGRLITFTLFTRYRIGELNFRGNSKYRTSRLIEEIESKPNGVLDEFLIKSDRDKIEEYYQKKGYSEVRVDYEIDRDPTTGYGDVSFRVDEGPKLKIIEINFVGNEAFTDKKLRKKMETKRKNALSWLSGGGKFAEEKFTDDLDILIDLYKEAGYLDAEISQTKVRLDLQDDEKIIVTIPIEEGRQYQVGDISIQGHELYTTEQLMSVLRLNTGDFFSPSGLDKDEQSLEDIYGRIGYLDTRVNAERIPNLETGAIDLKYTVVEGEEIHVETIKIEGNDKTKSIVILRELALAPGDVFDSIKMKASEARLKNTRFFEDVSVSPEPTNIPGRRNMKIAVEEGRTGNLTFGAGFSSLENGVLFVELSQGNFDLFNWRSFFQGDGQKFRLRLQVGSSSSEAILTFEEPWLFERRLAFGFEAFRTSTDFVSSVYDEARAGFEVYLRKRLIGLWEGRLSYRLESVTIEDVDPSAAIEIANEEGSRTVSKVGFSLVRDTRDSLLFTSRGERIALISEFAGVGGDTEYIRLEARAAKYIPTFETGNQVLSILARAGTLYAYSDQRTPLFDRYYLGGPNTVRGFDYREVGPKSLQVTPYDDRFFETTSEVRDETLTGIDENNDGDTTDTAVTVIVPVVDTNDVDGDGNTTENQPVVNRSEDPIGGDSYGFLSLEYSYQIAEPLRIAAFYDWGFVNLNDFDWDPGNYNSNWGLGLRLLIMGAPLRLDFGFPITTDPYNDDGAQFFFSFGTRF